MRLDRGFADSMPGDCPAGGRSRLFFRIDAVSRARLALRQLEVRGPVRGTLDVRRNASQIGVSLALFLV